MKIGILTHPLEINYGGNLQAFALQKTLLKMGFDAVTIDRHNRREYPSIWIHIAGYFKRLLVYHLKHRNVSTKWNPFISAEEYAVLSSNIQRFIDRNIRLTRKVYSDELAEIDTEYLFDAYVVGSDQVWLEQYCLNSFLDFVCRSGVKKLVYAASCNEKNSFFNNKNKVSECARLVKDFCGISVREKYLVSQCWEKLGVEACWVLDPTMLLTPKEYLEVIDNKMDKDPIVFSYILDDTPEKRSIVSFVAHELDLPFVDGNAAERVNDHTRKIQAYPAIDDWLSNIYRSRFVVTDSFHGTVFSILFNKPFVSIVNKRRGINRFKSLLELFGLESRLTMENDLSYILYLMNKNIDFESVNHILNEQRERSLSFIADNLI